MAAQTNTLTQLKKDKCPSNYLRLLMLHLACNLSFREASARAKLSGLMDVSDVAVMKRLQKAESWLFTMCVALFKEQGIRPVQDPSGLNVRLVDASIVKEPGKKGAQWRIHYSLQLSTLMCDSFQLTLTKGKGTGESFKVHDVKLNDHIIADRGYSKASDINYIAEHKAYCTVRVNTSSLLFQDKKGKAFPLLSKVTSVKRVGSVKSWDVDITYKENKIPGRLCVIKKSKEAAQKSQDKAKREAARKCYKLKPETLEYAKYIILFTTVPSALSTPEEITEQYRLRWQIELTFKRFKSITELGSLPKYRADSSRSWIYGKLFVALLTEKMIRNAESFSPWGYRVPEVFCQKESMA
ncbi:transposase is4-like [Desulfoluna spongiiphila]|nr:transposase is4-like [Desulfoluna spongiiphila]